MDSLLASYASSEEEEEEEEEESKSSPFLSLPKPKSSSLFLSLPQPKSKSLNPNPNPNPNPNHHQHQPKRVVQFHPPIKSTHHEDDDEDDKDEEKERNRRKESESLAAAQAPSVKSFLSSIPAPKNSMTLGVLSSRRSTIEAPQPPAESCYANYELGSHHNLNVNVNMDDQSQYVSSGGESLSYDAIYGSNWGDTVSGSSQSAVVTVLGKRGRKEIPTEEIVEIKQDELMKNRPREDQVKLTGIAFGPSYQVIISNCIALFKFSA